MKPNYGSQEMQADWNLFRTVGTILFIVWACQEIPTSIGSLSASEARLNWVVQADRKNRDAIVCIQGDKVDDFGNYSKESGKVFNGMGTGIIIDQRGYIVTNYHVVDGIRKIHVTTYDQNRYVARLVARDAETDLAIIKIDSMTPLKMICLGRSDDLMPGEYCMAIGNPYGYPFTVTDGRISGLGREVEVNDTLLYRDAIQTSTPINPGNSGGPLINVDGEMIGINAAIRQGAECIAFAIPVDQVVEVAAKLINEMTEKTAYHGLQVSVREIGGPGDPVGHVVVDSVDGNSPAAEAGFRKGDIVTTVGVFALTNKLDFHRSLLDIKSREDVAFTVLRNGETLDLTVSMGAPRESLDMVVRGNRGTRRGALPSRAETSPKTGSQGKPANTLDELVWTVLGIRYEPMPKDEYQKTFAKFLGDYPHGGVVVKAVREGSQMAEKGVLPGDVIVGLHEWVTTSQNDVRYIAKSWSTIKTPGNKVRLLLFRDGLPYIAEIPLK